MMSYKISDELLDSFPVDVQKDIWGDDFISDDDFYNFIDKEFCNDNSFFNLDKWKKINDLLKNVTGTGYKTSINPNGWNNLYSLNQYNRRKVIDYCKNVIEERENKEWREFYCGGEIDAELFWDIANKLYGHTSSSILWKNIPKENRFEIKKNYEAAIKDREEMKGYYLLKDGDVIQDGDEYLNNVDGRWHPVYKHTIGYECRENIRRKLDDRIKYNTPECPYVLNDNGFVSLKNEDNYYLTVDFYDKDGKILNNKTDIKKLTNKIKRKDAYIEHQRKEIESLNSTLEEKNNYFGNIIQNRNKEISDLKKQCFEWGRLQDKKDEELRIAKDSSKRFSDSCDALQKELDNVNCLLKHLALQLNDQHSNHKPGDVKTYVFNDIEQLTTFTYDNDKIEIKTYFPPIIK